MRKLAHVRKLWKGILDVTSVLDVFTDEPINEQKYDVDHFIPWSFVMNDELWNLMPMDSSLCGKHSRGVPGGGGCPWHGQIPSQIYSTTGECRLHAIGFAPNMNTLESYVKLCN